MRLGIRGHRDLEVRHALETRNEIRRVSKAIGMRRVGRLAFDRVAAQRDDVADALIPVATRDVENLAARCADAGEMRRTGQRRLALNARDEAVRALARGAVRTVS